MPAAAVASLMPTMAGMSGTSVGASGETAVDMGGASGFEQKEALLITSPRLRGEVELRSNSGEGEIFGRAPPHPARKMLATFSPQAGRRKLTTSSSAPSG